MHKPPRLTGLGGFISALLKRMDGQLTGLFLWGKINPVLSAERPPLWKGTILYAPVAQQDTYSRSASLGSIAGVSAESHRLSAERPPLWKGTILYAPVAQQDRASAS